MRAAVALLFLVSLVTLSATAQSNVPTKEDPKGYRDLIEPDKKATLSDLGEKTYTPPVAEPAAVPVKLPEDLTKIVAAQFGPNCKIATSKSNLVVNYRTPGKAEPWTPFLVADLDHDGVEDAVIVARCTNALARKDEFNYSMIDPYMAYHGYRDPKITSEISSGDPLQGHAVLIIHGAGPESWRAEKPKSKFLVLNLPFSDLGITKVVTRKGKPPAAALLLQEGETMSSVMFWDGKKYKWRDSIGNQ
ncbi:MAG TPA: hypothetical protein VMZ25_02950 [Terriglobales bacterium]|nr:hypothetical protein [Terriglobales bacterium]